MLLLQGAVILFALARYARQLLLRLADADASLETLTILAGGVAPGKSYLLVLIGIMLDVEFGLAGLNLVALLADALVGDIITLLLVFLFRVSYLQMPVDEGRGELVLGDGRRQQLGNSSAQEILLEDLPHAWSPSGIFDQHVRQKILQVLGVMRWDLRVAASQDLQHEALHGVGIESMPQGHHLVEDAAEGPNIRFLVVWLFLTDLGREVVWSSDSGLCAIVSMLEDSRDTKVTNLD